MLTSALIDPTENTNRVLALPAIAWVHQPIRNVSRGREDQQTFCIQIQPTHCNPTAAARFGQALEHQGAVFGIFARHHFARRFVIKQNTRHRTGGLTAQRTSVDPDQIHRTNPLSHVRWFAIDRYPTGEDQLLHVSTRTDTRFRQNFMQFGRIIIGQRTNMSRQPTPRIAGIQITDCP